MCTEFLTYLSPHVVKDGQQNAVKDARPKGERECAAVKHKRVKEDLQGAVADVLPRVKGQLRQPRQEGEPEVHVLILVAELQPLQTSKETADELQPYCSGATCRVQQQ